MGEGWRLPLVLPWNGRIPFDVETTLPRERQVGESASPRLDADRYFSASAAGFKCVTMVGRKHLLHSIALKARAGSAAAAPRAVSLFANTFPKRGLMPRGTSTTHAQKKKQAWELLNPWL
jgi:hypothetical protein